MSWDDFRFFLAVARGGSLRAASRALGVDQATVGRRVAALQERLQARLLEKRSDGYFLTATGERILASVETAELSMHSIDRLVTGKDERVEGVVKIAMPGALANQWILGELGPLLERHPGLELQFLTGPEVLNLARREADVAVRLVRPTQRDLRTRKVGQLQLGLYVARNHALAKGKLEGQVPFVGLFDRATSELERKFVATFEFEARYRLRSHAWSSVLVALRAGLGVGVLPTFIGERDAELRSLRRDRSGTPLWLVVHPEVAASARVRAVIAELTRILGSSID